MKHREFDPSQGAAPSRSHSATMTKPASSERPLCPGCIRPMKHRRNRRRASGLPELNIFECAGCGFMFAEAGTGAAPIAERASVLHLEAYTVQH